MTTWFTSDTHYFHRGILTHSNRPFDTVEEMNERLIENWNMVVRPGDTVYHLGDLTFGKPEDTRPILERLEGQKHLIRGNHDHRVTKLARYYGGIFESIQDYKEIKIEGQHIVLFHFPILSWHGAHRGWWHLHGHCHGNLNPEKVNGPMLDVGVDTNNLHLYDFELIQQMFTVEAGDWNPVDQHGSILTDL